MIFSYVVDVWLVVEAEFNGPDGEEAPVSEEEFDEWDSDPTVDQELYEFFTDEEVWCSDETQKGDNSKLENFKFGISCGADCLYTGNSKKSKFGLIFDLGLLLTCHCWPNTPLPSSETDPL